MNDQQERPALTLIDPEKSAEIVSTFSFFEWMITSLGIVLGILVVLAVLGLVRPY